MWHPKTILSRLREGTLLKDEAFAGIDLDTVLESRDRGEFDRLWTRAAKKVFSAWQALSANQSCKDTIDGVREAAFKKLFHATQGHEIAGYVSDDFDLICKAAVAGVSDSFVERLASDYDRQMIPRGV